MRNTIGEGTMCHRERALVRLALSYVVANLDDVNECFESDETLEGFIKINKDNDSVILREVEEREILELINLFD
jgi:hypothetical protein